MRWFRFYSEVVDDPKVQKLPAKHFRLWVNLLCIAAQNGGEIPSLDDLSFRIRVPLPELKDAMAEMTERGLFHVEDNGTYAPHNWNERQYKSDDVTARVRKHREHLKRFGNVSGTASETAPDTDTDTDTETPSGVGPHTTVTQGNERVIEVTDSRRMKVVAVDTELDSVMIRAAQSIHARHPLQRRDIGVKQIVDKLRTIANRYPRSERVDAIRNVDSNHAAWCKTNGWTKDGGEFAKGLGNWLAPTMERYAEPPAATETRQSSGPRRALII